MNRRQVIRSMALITGGTIFPTVLSTFLTGCVNKDMSNYVPQFFTKAQFDQITKIVDIIIPATKTKSASEVNAQVFVDQVFAECFNKEEQKTIKAGVGQMLKGFGAAKDQHQYVAEMDTRAYNNDEEASFFKTIKQYTMIGFFTSQEGETKASNYVKIPDGYKGQIAQNSETLSYGKTWLHY